MCEYIIDENKELTGDNLLSTSYKPDGRTSSEDTGISGARSRKGTAYSDDLSNYCAPKTGTCQNERLHKHCSYLFIPEDQMKSIMQEFLDELQRGLEAHKRHPKEWVEEECSFKMIDSCIEELPTGDETGVFYALDFGGTNLRAVRANLLGKGKIEKTQAKYSLKYEGPSAHDKGLLDARSTASQLFDHFAHRIKRVMESSNDIQENNMAISVGFTFSFPSQLEKLDSAILMQWTKGFETGRDTNDPVEHKDVGKLLKEAFQRNQTPAQLVAITNDTVGTLLSCSYQTRNEGSKCLIGIILGTGSNGCYFEENAHLYNYSGKIINIEFGNFNKKLPLTEVDLELDWNAVNKGYQLFEKLLSGAYLGEIVRRYVIRVFQHRTPIKAWVEETFSSEDAARIVNDKTEELIECKQCIYEKWNILFEYNDLVDIRSICTAVLDRSARLAAIAICAIALKTERLNEGITCGVDGSLYVKNKWYANSVRTHIINLLGEKNANNLYVVPADDGSGNGAAVLAAIASPFPGAQETAGRLVPQGDHRLH